MVLVVGISRSFFFLHPGSQVSAGMPESCSQANAIDVPQRRAALMRKPQLSMRLTVLDKNKRWPARAEGESALGWL